MCMGGGAKAPKKRDVDYYRDINEINQQNAMRQQAEEQMARQQTQYEEQRAIAMAPPPPGPVKSADVAGSALETSGGAAPAAAIRQGVGRKKLRKDLAGGIGGLSIPSV